MATSSLLGRRVVLGRTAWDAVCMPAGAALTLVSAAGNLRSIGFGPVDVVTSTGRRGRFVTGAIRPVDWVQDATPRST